MKYALYRIRTDRLNSQDVFHSGPYDTFGAARERGNELARRDPHAQYVVQLYHASAHLQAKWRQLVFGAGVALAVVAAVLVVVLQ